MKTIMLVLVLMAEMFALSICTGQTNDTSSIQHAIRDSAKWGEATNGIQLGVALYTPQNKNQFIVLTYLLNTNASGFYGPAPAPHGYRLDLSLQDSDGILVKRTKPGDALCKPVNLDRKSTMHIEMVREIGRAH